MALMCQGRVDFEAVELAHLIDFRDYFAPELKRLEPLVGDGLVELADEGIRLTEMGWFFVRGVAMVFDRYLQADRNRTRFSKII
jgi:oxygen-independent coproporphyrinogen-3 oxidase